MRRSGELLGFGNPALPAIWFPPIPFPDADAWTMLAPTIDENRRADWPLKALPIPLSDSPLPPSRP